MSPSQTQQLPLYLKLYQLVKCLYGIVRSMPRQYKYTLGEHILELAWRCLDLVIEINALPNSAKAAKIEELSVTFDKLKVRLRMAQEVRILSVGQVTHLTTYYLQEIGQMIGGWKKWVTKT